MTKIYNKVSEEGIRQYLSKDDVLEARRRNQEKRIASRLRIRTVQASGNFSGACIARHTQKKSWLEEHRKSQQEKRNGRS